jgi:hypothetical protein
MRHVRTEAGHFNRDDNVRHEDEKDAEYRNSQRIEAEE